MSRADRIETCRRARARGLSYRDITRVTGITKPDRYLPTSTDQEAIA